MVGTFTLTNKRGIEVEYLYITYSNILYRISNDW